MTKPPARRLVAGIYGCDALQVGDRFATAAVTLTGRMIDAFAALTGDRFGIHMDAEAARRRGFNGRVAHGLLVQSLADGLRYRTPARPDAIASPGWRRDFGKPVIEGDSIRAMIEVTGRRGTANPARGIVALAFRVRNQRNETVRTGVCRLMGGGRGPGPFGTRPDHPRSMGTRRDRALRRRRAGG